MRTWLRQGALSLFGLSLLACQPPVHIPATLYTPTVAGVVATWTLGPARTNFYTLTDGTSVTIDYAIAKVIDGSGNGDAGDLLLTDDPPTWATALRIPSGEHPPGCFLLATNGVDDGDHIKFGNGLRLPKAATFNAGIYAPTNGEYNYPQITFCVDDAGFVTSYGGAPRSSSP